MTHNDRSEIREMLHGVLAGYQALNQSAYETNQVSLNKIEKHLEKLNGKVAEHEKIITQNLPHSISQCPQTAVIQNIRDNMISSKAVIRSIILGITATGTLFSIFFIVYKVFIEKAPL